MSGYDSISDYAFDKFDIEKYDDYEIWLNDLENDFLENGRSPLDEIFDSSDFIRLENEWNKRKQIDVSEKLEDLKEDEEIERERRKETEEKEKEALEKFVLLNEQWEKDVKKIVKDLPKSSKNKLLTKFKNKVSKFFKKFFK